MTTYYVSTTGNNSNAGSSASPWKTIGHAIASNLKAGDEIVVRSGTYNEALNITKGGSAAGDVTIRSEEPGGALIRPPQGAWNTISVNASYVTIDGFDIKANNGDGIEANGVHHISILNNKVHDAGESGIQFNWAEFITIIGNETYNNARNGWFSGISIYETRNITGDKTTTGYRTIVKDNISYDNVTRPEMGPHTDGNGIILDDFQSTQAGGFPSYDYPTLVDGNIVYENGGKGIAVHWTNNVTVSNNTAYHNNQDNSNTGTWRGEFSNQDGRNNTWVNNIAVADPSVNPNNVAIGFYGGGNAGTKWYNNISFNGTAGQASTKLEGGNNVILASDGNKLGVNPQFVDPANGNFHVKAGSPAIDSGTSAYGISTTDAEGHPRVVGTVDIGAYESGSTGTPTNKAPVAKDDGGFSTKAGVVLTIDDAALLANDTDPDGNALSITGVSGATHGTVRINAGGDVVFTPTAGYAGSAEFTYAISDGNGGTASAKVALAVTGTVTPTDETSFFGASATPANTETSDPVSYELGMRFRTTADGEITALRYYRGDTDANDTDARTMTLWSSNGTKLASGKVTSAVGNDGWQTVELSTAVAVKAGTVYAVSYGTDRNYAYTSNYFATEKASADGLIVALANGGVYSEGGTGGFPTQTWKASNYWADVVFDPAGGTSQPEPEGRTIVGSAAADTLIGGDGDDVIRGLGGRDRIIGAAGADTLNGGGAEDVFVYRALADSRAGERDTIRDFARLHDTVDVSQVDAVAGGSDNAFTWRGGSAFTGTAGELRYAGTTAGLTLQGDVNGDGAADFQVALTGSYHSFFGQDLIL